VAEQAEEKSRGRKSLKWCNLVIEGKEVHRHAKWKVPERERESLESVAGSVIKVTRQVAASPNREARPQGAGSAHFVCVNRLSSTQT